MPLYTSSSDSSARRASHFLAGFAATLTILVVACGLWLFWQDPIWVWRDNPPWRSNSDGYNAILDQHHRVWKILVGTRKTEGVVIFGSSRVYRGIDPNDVNLFTGKANYNFGLSAPSIGEIHTAVLTVLDRRRPRLVAIGLDASMVRILSTPGLIPSAAAMWQGRLEMRLATLVGMQIFHSLARSVYRGRKDGIWRADGFKVTLLRQPQEIRQPVWTPSTPQAMAVMERGFYALDATLSALTEAGVPTIVFVNPLSIPQVEANSVAAHNLVLDRSIRLRFREIAMRHGVPFHDLAESHPFGAYDPRVGRNESWIDNSHFTPHVGRWVLERIGLRTANPVRVQ